MNAKTTSVCVIILLLGAGMLTVFAMLSGLGIFGMSKIYYMVATIGYVLLVGGVVMYALLFDRKAEVTRHSAAVAKKHERRDAEMKEYYSKRK